METTVVSVVPPAAPDSGRMPPSSAEALEAAVAAVASRKRAWARLPAGRRIAVIEAVLASFGGVAARWVEASLEAKGIPAANPAAAEEWLAGPYFILRNLRLLARSLGDIERSGRPEIPGGVTTRQDGQTVAHVFPTGGYDRIFYPPGTSAEVWMEPGVTAQELADTQAVAYRGEPDDGAVALVLGAGNVSSIGPMDVLYKLFVDNRAVVLKAHPVNDYLGPLLEEGFGPLVEDGFLRVVYGGAAEGAYLCSHPQVDEIHVTGSDRTVETIVFGPGDEGLRRKRERRPLLAKPITCELGNVSPAIVVPGPWSAADLTFHAESLVSTLVNNGGFNCNATRVIVQHAGWAQRDAFLAAIRKLLAATPPRSPYYPGARERLNRCAIVHPERIERFGADAFGRLPWALVPGLDPAARDEICFETEVFAGLFAETAVSARTVPEFLARAVAFANERLWGTLSASLIVHPATLRDRQAAAAVERAIADLRYGTVTINQWPAVGYGLVVTPWGAFPGDDLYDVQSGIGVVHNTLMFSRPQKSVVRVPFRVWPKPPWFVTHRTAHELAERLTDFEIAPSAAKLPAIVWTAARG